MAIEISSGESPKCSETLTQAPGQLFTAENEADVEEVRVKKQKKKILSEVSNQPAPESKLIPGLFS